jgi:hypothetical protein
MPTRLAFALVLLAVSACAPIILLVEPGPRDIGGAYQITTPIAWSRFAMAPTEQWTVDGLTLQNLHLFAGLDDGDVLFAESRRRADDGVPRYRRGMRASDVAEFVAASLAERGAGEVETAALRPAPFGALDGFRFDIAFLSGDGLAYRGAALGAVGDDGRLHLILYTGTRQHYFAAHLEAAEAIFGSVETP